MGRDCGRDKVGGEKKVFLLKAHGVSGFYENFEIKYGGIVFHGVVSLK